VKDSTKLSHSPQLKSQGKEGIEEKRGRRREEGEKKNTSWRREER